MGKNNTCILLYWERLRSGFYGEIYVFFISIIISVTPDYIHIRRICCFVCVWICLPTIMGLVRWRWWAYSEDANAAGRTLYYYSSPVHYTEVIYTSTEDMINFVVNSCSDCLAHDILQEQPGNLFWSPIFIRKSPVEPTTWWRNAIVNNLDELFTEHLTYFSSCSKRLVLGPICS